MRSRSPESSLFSAPLSTQDFVSINHRLSHGLDFGVNYMYSHALAGNIGEGGTVEDPTNIHHDYGSAGDDVRHTPTIQGFYRFQPRKAPRADTTTHAGKMIMTIFAGTAEFERDLIRECASAGRADAQKCGVRFGQVQLGGRIRF